MLITFFVAFSTCQSNTSGWGLFCFRVAGAMQDAPSHCNYGSIIVLAQKHLLSPCHLHFPISLENFVDPDDLLFSMTSQCIRSCSSCFPLILHLSLFFLSASPMHLEFQLICLSNQYLAVASVPLCPPLLGCLPSEHSASPSSCLEPLLFSFNILKPIFLRLFILIVFCPLAVWV